MKITCSQKELVEAVTKVQRSVATKSNIPALEGILVQAKEENIEFCGYDLEMGIKTKIKASVEKEGEIVLNAKTFSDIVRKLPEEDVTIEMSADYSVSIMCGQCEFTIIGLSAKDYPDLPQFNKSQEIVISSDILKSMIRQTIFAVAETDVKPVHTGTLFDVKNGELKLVSIDGYRFALRKEPISIDDDFSFVVPGKTLNEVLRLLPDEDLELTLSLGPKHITFFIDNYSVISRLLTGEFLQYESAIPGAASTTAIVNTRDFINSIERVSLLITEKLKSPVCCKFLDDTVQISCSTTLGRGLDVIPAEINGGFLEIGFNSRYLLDALRNTDVDQVKIEMTGSLGPLKIVPCDGDSFVFLVLPVRLNSDRT